MDGVTMFITLQVEDPFSMEDFTSSWDRAVWNELVNLHFLEAGKLLLDTTMPRRAIREVEGLRECSQVGRTIGVEKGRCEGISKGFVKH